MGPKLKCALVCIGVAAAFGLLFGRSDMERLEESRRASPAYAADLTGSRVHDECLRRWGSWMQANSPNYLALAAGACKDEQ